MPVPLLSGSYPSAVSKTGFFFPVRARGGCGLVQLKKKTQKFFNILRYIKSFDKLIEH
jgi:hypothetical protein